MTDREAVELANALVGYVRESVKEGATVEEVMDWTVREVLSDIEQTTPEYLRLDLHPEVSVYLS